MRLVPALAVIVAAALVAGCGESTRKPPRGGEGIEPIVWYAPAPHPYISEVKAGVEACEKHTGKPILKVLGQEWTQDNENMNVESLSTKGHQAFSIYPVDPAGSNGLFRMLRENGQLVVAYGAEPHLPTPAAFTVTTDIKGAAMFACEELIKLMGGKGNILNVLELVTDINTKKRDEGIRQVVAKHPGVKIVQTISGVSHVSDATTKIQSALAARADEIDGIICTGYNPTIAAAAVLTEWHRDPSHKRIRFVGIDTGPTVEPLRPRLHQLHAPLADARRLDPPPALPIHQGRPPLGHKGQPGHLPAGNPQDDRADSGRTRDQVSEATGGNGPLGGSSDTGLLRSERLTEAQCRRIIGLGG